MSAADADCINFDSECMHFAAYTPVRYIERTVVLNICGRLAIYGTGDYSRDVEEPVMGFTVAPEWDDDDFEF